MNLPENLPTNWNLFHIVHKQMVLFQNVWSCAASACFYHGRLSHKYHRQTFYSVQDSGLEAHVFLQAKKYKIEKRFLGLSYYPFCGKLFTTMTAHDSCTSHAVILSLVNFKKMFRLKCALALVTIVKFSLEVDIVVWCLGFMAPNVL